MGLISVLVAAVASYAFGAVWYMTLAKPWMAAAGISEEDIKGSDGTGKQDPLPFIVSGIASIIVAGMMRHILASAGIDGVGKSMITGLGIGLFLVTPWIATNYAFGMRPRNLTLIDGGYATFGCTIMGIVFGLF